jgi:hypothetical protein
MDRDQALGDLGAFGDQGRHHLDHRDQVRRVRPVHADQAARVLQRGGDRGTGAGEYRRHARAHRPGADHRSHLRNAHVPCLRVQLIFTEAADCQQIT